MQGRKQPPKPYKPLYLTAAMYVAAVWFWLFTVKVPDITPSRFAGYLLVLTSFLILVLVSCSIFFAAIRYLEKEYQKHENLPARFLIKFVVVWAAVEWLVSVIAALIWLGKGGSADTVLPFGSLTPLAVYTPLRFLTRLVGFHGFSAVVVLMLATTAFPKLRRWAVPVLGVAALGTVLAWLPYRTPTGPSITATIISGNLDQSLPTPTNESRVVVYPEYGLDYIAESELKKVLGTQKERFYVGSSKRVATSGMSQNILMFGSTTSEATQTRPKSRLIPGGEYLPYTAASLLKLFGQHQAIDQFTYSEAIERGPYNASPLVVSSDIKLGSAVCASIISTNDYRDFTHNGATVLTNSASLGLFNSPIFTRQHEGLARFMATANARPFLQSSFGNNAFALDHNGNMLQKTGPVSAKDVSVKANTKKTPYSLLGEWVVYIGIVWVAYAMTRKVWRTFS